MASTLRPSLLLLLLLQVLLLLSPFVVSNDEDKLFERINSYRASMNLPTLAENDNADCLADEIADQLEDKPCKPVSSTGPETEFSSYPKPLSDCHLNLNTTRDGVLMLACIPNGDSSLVLFNFTESKFAQYLNNSKYTGAGIGTEDGWVVVVLSTDTAGGSFAKSGAGAHLVPRLTMLALFVGGFVAHLLG